METVEQLIIKTHKASAFLRKATDAQIVKTLQMLADDVEENSADILKANSIDVSRQNPEDSKIDRLRLNEPRIKNIANSIRQISKLPNPTGKILEERTLYNGLLVEKRSVPLGVVGAIYESRPNVTFDIAALCLRSRNACVLKGSQEAEDTNKVAIRLIKNALKANDIDPDVVNLLPSPRETVQTLFTATRWVDVLIPRGSDGLIKYVRENSRVPVIETGAGVCHVYVEKQAD